MKMLQNQIYQNKFHTCDEFVGDDDISFHGFEELDASL